jgi:hypothetical protein
MFAKCANPACPRTFEYHDAGRFFRFTKRNSQSDKVDHEPAVGNNHPVEHYWLCERCAEIYTLVYMEGAGVMLKPQWKEMESPEILKHLVTV